MQKKKIRIHRLRLRNLRKRLRVKQIRLQQLRLRRLRLRRLRRRRRLRKRHRLGRIGPLIYNKKPIGKGTYGRVYQGFHRRTRKKVVIKMSPRVRKARREAAILRRVSGHRYIAKLIRFYVRRKWAYIIMERAPGKPLAKRNKWLWIGRKKSLKQAAIITIRTLQTVKYFQRKRIYHHDIGPTNIIARKNPIHIKLIDFGSACVHPKKPSYNSDVARSAYLMYFLLKGRARLDVLVRKKRFPPIHIRPRRLQRILRKATHPNQRFRYKNPSTLIKLLRPYARRR